MGLLADSTTLGYTEVERAADEGAAPPNGMLADGINMKDWMRSLAAQPCRPVQVHVPIQFHRKQWRVLYRHLVMVEQLIPLGLYRCEEAAGPLSPANIPYVFTAPPPETIVNKFDRPIVIVRHDNSLLRRVDASMTMGVPASS